MIYSNFCHCKEIRRK